MPLVLTQCVGKDGPDLSCSAGLGQATGVKAAAREVEGELNLLAIQR
ncbi:hypothetical protein [Thiorhodovibrio winogradskyi]|nr:hypothetical protein [Thiorhodovibrio winogradskyi]